MSLLVKRKETGTYAFHYFEVFYSRYSIYYGKLLIRTSELCSMILMDPLQFEILYDSITL